MTGGSPSTAGVSTALMTDRYELTMVAAALADGSAQRRCVFELFARRLPDGRRYGVVAGTGRLVESIERFRFGDQELEPLTDFLDRDTLGWLRDYRFGGDVFGYTEGTLLPRLARTHRRRHVRRRVLLETLARPSSTTTARWPLRRPDGHRRGRSADHRDGARGAPHEAAAVAAARPPTWPVSPPPPTWRPSAGTGIPTAGTARPAWILLHDDELTAFTNQVKALGPAPRCWWTPTTCSAAGAAVKAAAPAWARSGSTRRPGRAGPRPGRLDAMCATNTKIVLSGDLDEHAIAALRAERWTPMGWPLVGHRLRRADRGMVYKLVEVNGGPCAQRRASKESRGGQKSAVRRYNRPQTAIEEVVARRRCPPQLGAHDRCCRPADPGR